MLHSDNSEAPGCSTHPRAPPGSTHVCGAPRSRRTATPAERVCSYGTENKPSPGAARRPLGPGQACLTLGTRQTLRGGSLSRAAAGRRVAMWRGWTPQVASLQRAAPLTGRAEGLPGRRARAQRVRGRASAASAAEGPGGAYGPRSGPQRLAAARRLRSSPQRAPLPFGRQPPAGRHVTGSHLSVNQAVSISHRRDSRAIRPVCECVSHSAGGRV